MSMLNDKKLLLRNSLSGIVQLAITAVLTLISVPVLISNLGLNLYGVFAVLSVVSNLSTLADLGMDRALIVYLSKQGRSQESNYDIMIAAGIKLLLLCIIIGIGILFEHFFLIKLLAIPQEYYRESRIFYRLILVSNFFMILGMSFASVLDAWQRVYVNSIYRLLYSLLYWGGIVLVVIHGYGLKGIGIISVISAAIWFMFTIGGLIKYWGRISVSGLRNNAGRVFRKQIAYSSKIFSASLLSLFFEPLSKVLISNFIGLNGVALFDIALRIRGQIASLFSKAIYPLGPYIANTPISSDLFDLVINITKKIHLLIIPVALIFMFISKSLVYIWLGDSEDINDLALFVSVLCGSFLLLVPSTYPIYQYLYTKLLAGKTVYIQLTNVVVNVIIFLMLYKMMGIYTILMSNVIAYLCSYMLSMFYLKRYVGNITLEYYRNIIVTILGIGGIGLFICWLVPFSVFDLLIYPFTLSIVYLFFVRVLSLIRLEEIQKYFSSCPNVIRFASLILK